MPIDLNVSLDYRVFDNIVDRQLSSRLTGDTFAANVTWKSRRRPATKSDYLAAGMSLSQELTIFALYLTDQAVLPKVGDVVNDTDGVRYVANSVQKKYLGNIFDCYCTKEIA